MPKPETKLTNAIIDEYRRRGAFAEKIHGDAYQPRLVDIIACYRGCFVAVEVKIGGNKPTPSQLYVLQDVTKAGGTSRTVWSLDEATAILDDLDTAIKAASYA